MFKLIKILLPILSIFILSNCGQSEEINVTISPPDPAPTPFIEESDDPNAITAIGIYTGNVDEDTINVRLDHLPEEDAYASLDFSENSLEMFKLQEINPNEKIKVQYLEREEETPLILTIQRTSE